MRNFVSRLAIHVIKTKEITIMKKSIVALLISAGVLTGCAQNNATESVAETVIETSTEVATYNYVFGSGNYEPRDADALGTAV